MDCGESGPQRAAQGEGWELLFCNQRAAAVHPVCRMDSPQLAALFASKWPRTVSQKAQKF